MIGIIIIYGVVFIATIAMGYHLRRCIKDKRIEEKKLEKAVRGHCFDVIYVDPVSTSTLQAVVTDHEGDVEIVGNIYDNPEMLKKGGAE